MNIEGARYDTEGGGREEQGLPSSGNKCRTSLHEQK